MIDYSLYLVTDDPSRYAGNWLDNVVAAVEGGVTCVQYRDTESAPDVRLARVRALQDALGGRVPLIVNNEAELAATVHAEGVHVGQSDLPPAAVRAIVGPKCEIGLSITDISQLAPLADNRYVDALGIGPVFDARKTKADASDALGLEGLRAIVDEAHAFAVRISNFKFQISKRQFEISSRQPPTSNLQPPTSNLQPPTSNLQPPTCLPAVAIGGITLENAAGVLACGVDGLAVVSAFSKSADPYATAQSFRKLEGERREGVASEGERRETRDERKSRVRA